MTKLHRLLLLFFLTSCAGFAQHADPNSIESNLRTEFAGKIVVIRGFYDGTKLRFSRDGTLIGKARRGYWTSEGMVKISDVSLENGKLVRIKGTRVLNLFDQKTGKFENFTTHNNLQIDLEIDPTSPDLPSTKQLISKVLTQDVSELKTMTPDYWECWVNGRAQHLENGEWSCPGMKDPDRTGNKLSKAGQEVSVAGPNPARELVYIAGKGVEPPRGLSTTDPEYSHAAKDALIQGVTVLWVIIDEKGEIAQIGVQRPLGAGLDDRAVEAVRKWRFAPARKDGKPVPAMINVEVKFRLY